MTVADIGAVKFSNPASVGAAAGVGTASGVGVALRKAVGAAAGVGIALGASLKSAGAAAGTSTALGVSAYKLSGIAAAAGIALATATGAPLGGGAGLASGAGTLAAQSAVLAAGVGASAGTANAVGLSAPSASLGAAAGVAVASGVGASLSPAVGASSGTGASSAVGAALGRASGTAAGTASVAALSGPASALGTAAGTSSVTGSGAAQWNSVGASSGTSAAVALSGPAAALGAASGIGAASAVSAPLFGGVAASSGTGAAAGVSALTGAGTGAAAGIAAASGVGGALSAAAGSAAGTSSAIGLTGLSAGSSAGVSTVSGAGVAVGGVTGASGRASVTTQMRLDQGFPKLSEPAVDPQTGRLNQTWLQLLISLWNRTGQGSGDVTPAIETGSDAGVVADLLNRVAQLETPAPETGQYLDLVKQIEAAALLAPPYFAVTTLQGRTVSGATPADTNVLAWSAAHEAWEPTAGGGGAGTVTSVGLSLPADFTVSGSPVVGAGTLTGVWGRSILQPQGRATLQTGVPVMTSDQTAKSTIYYDTYDTGNLVPVFNGTSWVYLAIGSDEISMGLDAVTPHIASGSVYDIWAFSVAGVLTIGAGPAWTSTTARGTGAGTTEWQWLNGVRVNKNALTHVWGGASGTTDYGSISAQQATLLGSFYATAAGQTGMAFVPAAASGGANPFLALHNAYNRVPVMSRSQDNGGSAGYTYASTTWRTVRASSSNRITWLDGLQQSFFDVSTGANCKGFGTIGTTIDSTTNAPVSCAQGIGDNGATSNVHIHVADTFAPLLGLHFAQAMEVAASGTATFFTGGATPTRQDQYINIRLEM